MTMLTICQDVAKTAGLTVPTTVAGVVNADNIRLLDAVNTAGRELARPLTSLGATYKWSVLHESGSVTTVVDTNSYLLPTDCHHIVNMTLWDQGKHRPLRSVGAVMWQLLNYSGYGNNTILTNVRVKGNYLYLFPTPTSVYTIQFEYISKNWAQSALGVDQQLFIADSDVGILDEYLIELGAKWRLARDLGRDYATYEQEYREALNAAISNDNLADPINVSNRRYYLGNPSYLYNFPVIAP